MRRLLRVALTLVVLTATGVAAAFPKYIDLPPKAVASMTVPDDQLKVFADELNAFAKSESLTLNATIYPDSPEDTIGAIIVTPKENEIQIIKGLKPGAFDVYMSVRYEGEDWKPYWDHLQKSIGAHFKWQDEVVSHEKTPSLKADIGLGFVQLGERESDIRKIFKTYDSGPAGDSGQCTVYDIKSDEIHRLMPGVDADILELSFSPSTHSPGAESVLTLISVGISAQKSSALSNEYKELLGPSVWLDAGQHVESWKLSDGTSINISHYSDQSSVSFRAQSFHC